jgi:hypothetical protein
MGKCEFFDECRCADPESPTCTETNGEYYGPGRMAGCGRDLSVKGKRSIYHKECLNSTIAIDAGTRKKEVITKAKKQKKVKNGIKIRNKR